MSNAMLGGFLQQPTEVLLSSSTRETMSSVSTETVHIVLITLTYLANIMSRVLGAKEICVGIMDKIMNK